MKLHIVWYLCIQFALRLSLSLSWKGYILTTRERGTVFSQRNHSNLIFNSGSPAPDKITKPQVQSIDCGFTFYPSKLSRSIRSSSGTGIAVPSSTRKNLTLQMPPFSISRAFKISRKDSTFAAKSTLVYKCWRAQSIVEINFPESSKAAEAIIEFKIDSESLLKTKEAKLTFVLFSVTGESTDTVQPDSRIRVAGFIKNQHESHSLIKFENFIRMKADILQNWEQVDCNVFQLLQVARIKMLQEGLHQSHQNGKPDTITIAFIIQRQCDHFMEAPCPRVLNERVHKPSLRLFYE
ncbi:unnamed protein product [Orchesella dallaii]|uniref:Uncharacterized protein n=1 Tax=Orchesella dallaii TaxID=48710 RepID=A0ABP1R650_9HEXA